MSKKTKLIQKLSNYDWRYIVDCSYDITESSYHYELCANDYCRCTTLENLKVESFSTEKMALAYGYVPKKYKKSIDVYGLERILNHFIKDGECFDPAATGGYYGEELGSIKLHYDIGLKVDEAWSNYIKLNTLKAKVLFLLNLEYGYILDSLKNARFVIRIINKDCIVFPNQNYYKNLDNRNYDNYELILGICKKSGQKYEVIDGYHRISVAKPKKIQIIVAYQ